MFGDGYDMGSNSLIVSFWISLDNYKWMVLFSHA
jgi:hypothetical protein